MRVIPAFVCFWLIISRLGLGLAQPGPLTKIYLYASRPFSIKTTRNADQPIRINYFTLVETNLDTLSFRVLPDQIVQVPFERGRTYYFRTVGSGSTTEASLTTSTEQEFWLNVNAFGQGKYRHYLLDKQTGLKLLEEKR